MFKEADYGENSQTFQVLANHDLLLPYSRVLGLPQLAVLKRGDSAFNLPRALWSKLEVI